MRNFETGATRNSDNGKYDYEGFLSPRVLEAFGAYMHYNRLQEDGKVRDSDNWQKGIPQEAYIKSGWRHFFDWWREHRGLPSHEGLVFALCGLMFNVMGYLDNYLKVHVNAVDLAVCRNTAERQKRWDAKKQPSLFISSPNNPALFCVGTGASSSS